MQWLGWALMQCNWCPFRGNSDRDRHTRTTGRHTGEPHVKMQGQCDASKNQRKAKIARKKIQERKKTRGKKRKRSQDEARKIGLQVPEGAWLCRCLDFWLLTSRLGDDPFLSFKPPSRWGCVMAAPANWRIFQTRLTRKNSICLSKFLSFSFQFPSRLERQKLKSLYSSWLTLVYFPNSLSWGEKA